MLYNTNSESDLESETNFQQPPGTAKMSNNSNFVRNSSIKNSNKPPPQRNSLTAANIQRRRASDCSYYNVGDGADNASYYGMPIGPQKRGSLGGAAPSNGLRRGRSNKSVSTSSDAGSTGSRSSTCSGDDTTSTSSGQPNLPYPGFVEYSFKYLSQDARPRNWCLQLITNP